MFYEANIYERQVRRRYQDGEGEGSVRTAFVGAIVGAFGEDMRVSDFEDFGIEDLLDYIRRTHAYYLSTKLPEIGQTILSLGFTGEADRRLLCLLEAVFTMYYRRLEAHIRDEEKFLLPYIEGLLAGSRDGGYSLDEFERGHGETEAGLEGIKAFINAYYPSEEDRLAYRVLIAQMDSFETDLRVHAFIEDEVLIPKARRLELRRS